MLRRLCGSVLLVLAGGLASALPRSDAPAEAVVTDVDGKEVKVSALKFGTGTRRLPWVPDAEDKKGALVLELREPYREAVLQRFLAEEPPSSIAARHGVPDEAVPDFLNLVDKIEREKPEVLTQKLAAWSLTLEQVRSFIANPANASPASSSTTAGRWRWRRRCSWSPR